MIPEKGKVYYINYEPNDPSMYSFQYRGLATYTGNVIDKDLYEFSFGDIGSFALFSDEDIIEEGEV